jgi:hypothetical protein
MIEDHALAGFEIGRHRAKRNRQLVERLVRRHGRGPLLQQREKRIGAHEAFGQLELAGVVAATGGGRDASRARASAAENPHGLKFVDFRTF